MERIVVLAIAVVLGVVVQVGLKLGLVCYEESCVVCKRCSKVPVRKSVTVNEIVRDEGRLLMMSDK